MQVCRLQGIGDGNVSGRETCRSVRAAHSVKIAPVSFPPCLDCARHYKKNTTVTLGEMLWLLFGAVLGAAAAYAIPYGITLVGRLTRSHGSAMVPPSTPAPERVADASKPSVSD